MVSGDLLRMAWEAEHDGRSQLRDSLLTLAIAESEPDAPWVQRCRARLVAGRPDHFLGKFATVALALDNPRVIAARDRLRVKYPPARVQSLLLRARARRGPYLGRVESLEAMLDDLAGPPAEAENVRLDSAQGSRGPLQRQRSPRSLARALAYPPMPRCREDSHDPPFPEAPSGWDRPAADPLAEDFSAYYLAVLLAIACLLATVQKSSENPPLPRR